MLALLLLAATACAAGTSTPPVTPTPSAPGMPPPGVPDPRETTRAYLDAWQAEDYPAMYGLLTSISQDAINPQEFAEHYQGISTEAALKSINYEILSSLTNPDTAQVGYRVFFDSALAGEFRADTLMNLTLENGQWRVQWDDTLVMPQLKGNNYLSMVRQGFAPARANIYDRNGHALAAQGDAVALGLYPDEIDPAQADLLFSQLSELTGLTPEAGHITSVVPPLFFDVALGLSLQWKTEGGRSPTGVFHCTAPHAPGVFDSPGRCAAAHHCIAGAIVQRRLEPP